MTKQFSKRAAEWYKWGCGWLPMFRRTHDAILETAERGFSSQLAAQRHHHNEEVAKTLKAVDRILDRAVKTDYDVVHDGYYELRLVLEPAIFTGQVSEDLRILGQLTARRVEREIATSRFIEKARENRRRRTAA